METNPFNNYVSRFLVFLDELRSSFWLIPVVTLIASIGIAIGMVYLDYMVGLSPSGFGNFLFCQTADSARSVLSIIAGAMVGVAGTVFSITLVALALASSQFGPRVLRNFMSQRINQVVLGTYISTYVYCLIVLNAITDNGQTEFIPAIAILGAMVGAVLNMVLLIFFIHNIAVSIQADHLISVINRSLSRSIDLLFPEIGEDGQEGRTDFDLDTETKKYIGHSLVNVPISGYLQNVDHGLILRLATEHKSLIVMKNRPGDYLVKGAKLADVHHSDGKVKELAAHIRSAVVIGEFRTPLQDVEYSIHQLVQIAARALSPGINDPYTAITCVDNLTSNLCRLTQMRFPSKYECDEHGNLRACTQVVTYQCLLDTAFNQIRQFGEGLPSVLIRLMASLAKINGFARTDEQRTAIREQADAVMRLAKRTFHEEKDLADMEKKYARLSD